MMMRHLYVSEYPNVFRAMSGLYLSEFDELIKAVLRQYAEAERARLRRPGRKRDIGAGHPLALSDRDPILLSVVWLRVYPTQAVLGYVFGVSDSAARSAIERVLPVLEAAGRDTMRLPDPGRKRRRKLDDLLRDTPELAVVIDTFEQRVQATKHKPISSIRARKRPTRLKAKSLSMRKRARSWMSPTVSLGQLPT
jgi:Helix-turn-helix of DDE superfamily endonuclease